MKHKLIILTIFLVSLLAISAVSANDLAGDVTGDEIAIDDNLEITQDDTIATTHAVKGNTFADIQNAVNDAKEGDTIVLSGNYVGNGSHVKITKTLTVEGKGAILDANHMSKMFEITGTNVKINNMTFINGYGVSSGAIDWWFGSYSGGNDGKGLLTNCKFFNCRADYRAGAVYFCNSNLTMRDCYFENNRAGYGGAVYVSGRDCIVQDCYFENNIANEKGGGLFLEGGDDLVDNCYFGCNLASQGGAFYLKSTDSSAWELISNCYFEDNKNSALWFVSKRDDDGSEYFDNISIVNCDFTNNYDKDFACSQIVWEHTEDYVLNDYPVVNCTSIFDFKSFNQEIYDLIESGSENIELSGNYVCNGSYVDIYKSVTIVGKGETIIDCGFKDPVFRITADNVVLDNLTFINAFFSETNGPSYDDSVKGLFLFNGENITIKNCVFINNHGLLSLICVSGYNCIFENCNFINNNALLVPKVSATSNSITKYDDWGDEWFTITYNGEQKSRPYSYELYESIFSVTYNYEDTAGAIYWRGDNGTIDGCGFLNNYGYHNGYNLIGKDIKVITRFVLTASDITMYNGGSQKYSVTLTKNNVPVSDVYVKVTVRGVTSSIKTDSNGKASMDLDLPVGIHDITAVYGDSSTTSKVTVKSTITTTDCSGEYLNAKVSATFLNTAGNVLSGKKVSFKIADKTYTATTNSDGVATADVDLGVGTYTVTAVNPVNGEQKQFKLVIDKASSAINLVSSQNNGVTTLTATLTPSSATGSVVFNINGDDKTATVKNGKAILTLSDLDAGNYTATASYSGDSNLNGSISNTVNFTVAEIYPILTANPVTKIYGTATKLVVNLADNKGNAIANANVKVVIGSVTKTIKTNAAGKATMDITNTPGTYTATITYADAKATPKIIVKKATPKLTATAKTFKIKDRTKKYTVTLKTNKNAAIKNTKITLKVNGKTYSAKTNAKGVATFKLTKLTKKGKFAAVVKFAGNSCYNSKTLKPKLTVK